MEMSTSLQPCGTLVGDLGIKGMGFASPRARNKEEHIPQYVPATFKIKYLYIYQPFYSEGFQRN